MANFLYDESSAKNDAVIGKFLHPLKAIITNESDLCIKERKIVDILANREKSNRYAETITGQTDFDTFQAKVEGAGAENDSIALTRPKTIKHVSFAKNFTITKEMADDAIVGIGKSAKARLTTDMKTKARSFTRSFYKTERNLIEQAYINADKVSMKFNKGDFDLTTADGLPVFHSGHTYAPNSEATGTQCNYFFNSALTANASNLSLALDVLSNKMRNFKDENGDVMGYTADTIIIPSNRPLLEKLVKEVCGTERVAGSNNNDINIQYGNWRIIVLTEWQATRDEFMLMSTEANENLSGTMFYERHPLDIKVNVDYNTRNTTWNGYFRVGVGFTTWKHLIRAVNIGSLANAEKLTEITA